MPRRVPALLLLLASACLIACDASPAPAPAPDGGDAPDGPPVGVGEVLVAQAGEPAAGRVVAFHDRDGVLLAVAESDADGVARGPRVDGGMVTIATAEGELLTIAGIRAEGELRLDEQRAPVTLVELAVDVPALPAGADTLDVGCGDPRVTVAATAAPLRLPVTDRCLRDDGTIDVVVAAYATRDDGRGLVGYLRARGIDPDAGAVRLGGWRSELTGASARVSALAPTATAVSVALRARDGARTFAEVRTARALEDGAASIAQPTARVGDAVESTIRIAHGELATQALRVVQSGVASSDLTAADLLPVIAEVALDDRRVTWRTAAPADATTVTVALDGWELIAPGDAEAVIVPEVPASLPAPAALTLRSVELVDDRAGRRVRTSRRLAR